MECTTYTSKLQFLNLSVIHALNFKPSNSFCNTKFNIKKFYVLPIDGINVILYGPHKKQLDLFPYTAIIDSFYNRDSVCLPRGTKRIFKYNPH
jgi:hypothetical protein